MSSSGRLGPPIAWSTTAKGSAMTAGLPAGWYTSEGGRRRYWTGNEWLVADAPHTDDGPTDDPLGLTGSEPAVNEQTISESAGTDQLRARPRSRRRRVLIVAGVVAVAAGAAATWWFLRPTLDDRVVAGCQDALRERLRDPAGAVFHGSHVVDHEVGMTTWLTAFTLDFAAENDVPVDEIDWDVLDQALEDEWVTEEALRAEGKYHLWVTGEVDAQNGFGATGRSEWTCRAFVEDGEITSSQIWAFDGDYSPGSPPPSH